MENHENFTRVLSKKLLYCAIIFEIVAVTAGLVIAVGALYEAIQASPQHTPGLVLNASLGALPFALAALAEGTKIPLTYGFFNATGAWRIVIAVTLLAIAGITFENTVTGLERAYTVRAASVESLQKKKAALDQTISEEEALKSSLKARRAELEAQLNEVNAQEMREIELHTERCKAVGASCNSKPYLEDIRRASEVKRQPLQRDIAAIDDQLAQRSVTALQNERATAESALAAAAYENQIYRMAARFFGKRPEEVTVAEANFVGKVWFGSIGLIVAITGIVLAGAAVLVARPPQKAGALSRMMKRTLLAARKRARVEVIRRVEVPGPERVVEKVVEKLVPQVRKIIVYLPRGYDLNEVDKADIEAEVEAQLSNGQFKFDHVGGHA